MITIYYGETIAQIFGSGNELQGLLYWDIPNLGGRLSGDSPWAYQIDDFFANETGYFHGGQYGQLNCGGGGNNNGNPVAYCIRQCGS